MQSVMKCAQYENCACYRPNLDRSATSTNSESDRGSQSILAGLHNVALWLKHITVHPAIKHVDDLCLCHSTGPKERALDTREHEHSMKAQSKRAHSRSAVSSRLERI
jgi:hypothetical protein